MCGTQHNNLQGVQQGEKKCLMVERVCIGET